MMKSALLVVLLAAAATAAVVSNDVPDAVELPDKLDVSVNDVPEELVNDLVELPDELDVNLDEELEVVVTDVLELPDSIDGTDAEEETVIDTRRNLSVGSTCSTRIYNQQHSINGVLGRVSTREIRVPTSGRIAAVRVTRIGTSQNATPSIIGGGVRSTSVTIRIRSASGRGFNYRVEVYAI